MKKAIILYLFFGLLIRASAQQDAHFSQYVFNGIYINPAYTGYKQQLYLQNFYSSQWTGLLGAPKSFSLAADASIKDNNVGLGLLMNHDQVGAQTTSAIYVNYAYRLRIGDKESSRLAFGIAAGAIQTGIEGTLLDPVDPGDVFIPEISQHSTSPDVRTGIFYSNDLLFAGFSADNLLPRLIKGNKSRSLLIPVPKPHYYLSGGCIFPLSESIKFKPTFLIQDDLGGPTSLDVNGFLLLKERIWFGGLYRKAVKLYEKKNLEKGLTKSGSAGVIMEIFATTDVRFGYAFEYSTNKLRNLSAGSHEVSLGITFGGKGANTPKCYF